MLDNMERKLRLFKDIFRPKREGELHLVVHEDEIMDHLRREEGPEWLMREYKRAEKKISEIKQLPNSASFTSFDSTAVAPVVGNAELVILYGTKRAACLRWVSEEIIKAGASVAISIEGSV